MIYKINKLKFTFFNLIVHLQPTQESVADVSQKANDAMLSYLLPVYVGATTPHTLCVALEHITHHTTITTITITTTTTRYQVR